MAAHALKMASRYMPTVGKEGRIKMKNVYKIIKITTDTRTIYPAETMETFSNLRDASKAFTAWKRLCKAGNGLRECEGGRERSRVVLTKNGATIARM